MRRLSGRVVAAGLLAVVAITACSTPPREPEGVRPGASEEASRPPAARATADLGQPRHTEADVRFLRHMIPHHAQALVMTELVPTRTSSDAIRLIAERIEVSQHDEIARMQRWLTRRGERAPDVETEHAGHGMGNEPMMPGMLSQAQLDQLAATRGAEFDRLFLEFMIRHHQGALTMVEELFGSPGAGQESELFSLASDIDADQRAEIARMEQVLSALPSAGVRR